jgi:hypothetical protein
MGAGSKQMVTILSVPSIILFSIIMKFNLLDLIIMKNEINWIPADVSQLVGRLRLGHRSLALTKGIDAESV